MMKRYSIIALGLSLAIPCSAQESAAQWAEKTVILNETASRNLQIETVEIEETDFAETAFALGRIRVAPGRRAVVSTRVPGRVLSVSAHIDTPIVKGAEVAVIESRQPGDPPPSVRVTAPISGLVSAMNIVAGQPVAPEDTMVEIIDLEEVHAMAAVPEHLFSKLQLGQKATIRLAALPSRTFDATLAHLGAEADEKSGTLEAAFHVENPEGLLRPGMRAEFSIILSQRAGVLSVPREAVQGDAFDRYVYVEDYDLQHAYVKAPVVIGARNDRFIEILSGVLAGDKVVTRGAYSLAFAGRGTVSLKEALDAAHGHKHAEDGSELSASERAGTSGGTVSPATSSNGIANSSARLWMIISAVLFVLLLISTFAKRTGEKGDAS